MRFFIRRGGLRMTQHSIFEITEVGSSFDRLRMNGGIKLRTNGGIRLRMNGKKGHGIQFTDAGGR